VISVRGKQHEISTGTPDLMLAKRFHRQKLDELAADRQGLKQFTTPQHRQLQFASLLEDLVSDYRVRRVKSLASVLSHLKPLRDYFGDWRAVAITFRAIETYITTRREDEKSNATINRELELLRRAVRLAHDRQLLPSIPKVRVLPENNTRQGFFERPDLEAVVAALPAYLQGLHPVRLPHGLEGRARASPSSGPTWTGTPGRRVRLQPRRSSSWSQTGWRNVTRVTSAGSWAKASERRGALLTRRLGRIAAGA
jgi:hypothetical protein